MRARVSVTEEKQRGIMSDMQGKRKRDEMQPVQESEDRECLFEYHYIWHCCLHFFSTKEFRLSAGMKVNFV